MAARIADISEVMLALGLSDTATDEERAIANEALKRAEASIAKYIKYDPVQATRTEYYPRMNFRLAGESQVWEADANTAYLSHLAEGASSMLQLANIPIRSITSLNVDYDGRFGAKSGSFGVGTAWTEGDDFWPGYDLTDSDGNSVCLDGIIRTEGRWPAIAGSVKVVYVAGYTDAELHGQDSVIDASPILEAVIDESVRRVKKIYSRMKSSSVSFETGLKTSEKLGEYSYETDSNSAQTLVGGQQDMTNETKMKLEEFVHYGVHAL